MAVEQRIFRKKRPVNLNLFSMNFPLTAIASILHRISGVILFIMLPFLLWAFSLSLASPDSFFTLQNNLRFPIVKFLTWAFLSGLSFHMLTGIRHLFGDLGYGETLKSGKLTAQVVMLLAIIFAIVWGVWLW